MPAFDDDDEIQQYGHEGEPGDSIDQADVPDNRTTVRCPHCRKYIFEDSEQCPYCKSWLTGQETWRRKPLWFVLAAILCLIAAILWAVFGY